eukprot:320351-Chlamydomonas_euryale.AAC.2
MDWLRCLHALYEDMKLDTWRAREQGGARERRAAVICQQGRGVAAVPAFAARGYTTRTHRIVRQAPSIGW